MIRLAHFNYGLVLLLLTLLMVMSLAACALPSEVVVLANMDIYKARLEPEMAWQGKLLPDSRGGEHPPDWIGGIRYKLETTEGLLYLDTEQKILPALDRLLHREVVVVGKLVAIELRPDEIILVGKVMRDSIER